MIEFSAPTILSNKEIGKMEKMNIVTKSTSNWFKRVTDISNKAIHYKEKMHNNFLILKNEIEKEMKKCQDFPILYNITCPKLK
jgi:hypothetical protein